MIGMNTGKPSSTNSPDADGLRLVGKSTADSSFTGNSSAAESPFGGIKESGYGKESGKDVAVAEYLITKTGTLTLEGHF